MLTTPDALEITTLAGSAVDVWRALERPRSLPELAAELADAFDRSAAEIEQDIAPIIHRLLDAHLIERRAG